MAVIPSLQKRFEVAEEVRRLATDAVVGLKDAIELEKTLKQDERGMDLSFAKTQMEGALAGSQGPYNLIIDGNHAGLLDAGTPASIWPVTISPSFAADLDSFLIDNVASPPTITANGGTPFDAGVLAVGDVVELTKAEEPEHNGRATITIITTAVITLTAGDMPGTGVINSADTTAVIDLLER